MTKETATSAAAPAWANVDEQLGYLELHHSELVGLFFAINLIWRAIPNAASDSTIEALSCVVIAADERLKMACDAWEKTVDAIAAAKVAA